MKTETRTKADESAKLERYLRRQDRRVALPPIICVIVFVVLITIGGIALKGHLSTDREGTILQYAVGTIEHIEIDQPGEENLTPSWNAMVRVNDRLINRTFRRAFQPGDRLHVRYRIGKSGAFYIEELEPFDKPER